MDTKNSMEPVILISDVVNNIVGKWHSPSSKDSYNFYPAKSGYAKLVIEQFDSKISITCAYKIIQESKILYLDIDNMLFEIIQIKTISEPVLIIKNQKNKIVTLSKKFDTE